MARASSPMEPPESERLDVEPRLWSKGSTDLLIVGILSLVVVPLVIVGSGPVRIVLGLSFVSFFPGYALIAALFPREDDLSGITRLGLSLGISIVIVPMIGLILNYTAAGVTQNPILISLTLFIFAMLVIAWYRRQRLPPVRRFGIRLGATPSAWSRLGQTDKVVSLILALAILGVFSTTGYVIANPEAKKGLTEFYILGAEGKAENYPGQLTVGETGEVILVIANHEDEELSYRVEITIEGEPNSEIGPILLAREEEWNDKVSFVPRSAGEKQKLEFILYKDGESEPYDRLHLWLDVKDSG